MLVGPNVNTIEDGPAAVSARPETRNDTKALAALRRGGRAMRELADALEKCAAASSSRTEGAVVTAVIVCSGDGMTEPDAPSSCAAAPPAGDWTNLERATLAFQRDHIARVLDAADGNREAAAKLLGLSPATLYRYLQKVGLKGYGHG